MARIVAIKFRYISKKRMYDGYFSAKMYSLLTCFIVYSFKLKGSFTVRHMGTLFFKPKLPLFQSEKKTNILEDNFSAIYEITL